MLLSEIKYSDILRCSRDELSKIVFTETEPLEDKKHDYGILVGSLTHTPARADKAIELYHGGLLDKIIVTGGDRYPEPFKTNKYLLVKGVPSKDIIIDAGSINLVEAAEKTFTIVRNGTIDYPSLAIITSDYNLRRCLALFSFYFNPSSMTGIPVVNHDSDYWLNTISGYKTMLKEALLLCYYEKHCLIDDMEIEGLSLSRVKKDE